MLVQQDVLDLGAEKKFLYTYTRALFEENSMPSFMTRWFSTIKRVKMRIVS